MEFRFNLLPISAFLFVTLLVKSNAITSSTEEYWKKVLPNTPIPKSIQDSLNSDITLEAEGGTGVHVGGHRVDVGVGKPGKGSTGVHVGKGGTSVDVHHPKGDPFVYQYAASQTQLQLQNQHQNQTLFFKEKDLKPGTRMTLHFTKPTHETTTPILPLKTANSIPFSSSKLPQILSQLGVSPNSEKAKLMSNTLSECETPSIQGEDKFCATSLESMVDYASSKLGKKVNAFSTYVHNNNNNKKEQKYVIKGVKKVSKNNEGPSIVCHKMKYAFAVFYCHKTKATKNYMVSLVGEDGTKIKGALVVCHNDTSKWNPKHLAFQVLKVKPGTVPVCHFLPQDHIVWVPKHMGHN